MQEMQDNFSQFGHVRRAKLDNHRNHILVRAPGGEHVLPSQGRAAREGQGFRQGSREVQMQEGGNGKPKGFGKSDFRPRDGRRRLKGMLKVPRGQVAVASSAARSATGAGSARTTRRAAAPLPSGRPSPGRTYSCTVEPTPRDCSRFRFRTPRGKIVNTDPTFFDPAALDDDGSNYFAIPSGLAAWTRGRELDEGLATVRGQVRHAAHPARLGLQAHRPPPFGRRRRLYSGPLCHDIAHDLGEDAHGCLAVVVVSEAVRFLLPDPIWSKSGQPLPNPGQLWSEHAVVVEARSNRVGSTSRMASVAADDHSTT